MSRFGAEVAEATLDLAAEAWTGDPAVADWLSARAEHVADAGVFDGKHWPTADVIDG